MDTTLVSDLNQVFIFWITLLLIGVTNLPLTMVLFHKFIDRGYGFSKVIGLGLGSYLVWLLSTLTLLPFTRTSILLCFGLLFGVNIALFFWLKKNNYWKITPKQKRLFVWEESIFLLLLIFWSYVRGFAPEINSLEKFMDYGFVSSILKTEYFPPLDMWLSKSPSYQHNTINYYYFGHYITALLAKLSQVPSQITYNIMLAFLFSQTFLGSFSLAASLIATFQKSQKLQAYFEYSRRTILCGLLAGFLTALGGNLHTIYALTTGYPISETAIPPPPWELSLENPLDYETLYNENGKQVSTITDVFGFNAYWYPNATRFIPNTIHEFPIYSFVVSDLHGHVLDIPFVLLIVALLYSLLQNRHIFASNNDVTHKTAPGKNLLIRIIREIQKNPAYPHNIIISISLGFLLAIMYMTNAWDGIIYFGMAVIVINLASMSITTREPGENEKTLKISILNGTIAIKTPNSSFSLYYPFTILTTITTLISLYLFSLPFNRHFIPFAQGIGINCITPNSNGTVLCDRSPLWMIIILWGHFIFFAAGFTVIVIYPFTKKILNKNYSINDIWTITKSDIMISVLIAISAGLLIAPEFIFARDIYPTHYRANTMFKLGYQAFMLLSITVAYIIFRFRESSPFTPLSPSYKKPAKIIFWTLGAIQLFLVGIYPYFAINSYYGGLTSYQGLDGTKWLEVKYLGDYEAVEYFKNNLGEFAQPTVLEAVGESYTEYGRISAYTGLPTPLGWPVHEWLWRGSYDEPGIREPEIKTIYEAESPEIARELLDKYNIKYVVVGILENDKYPNINENNFYELGTLLFQKGSTRIYEIN